MVSCGAPDAGGSARGREGLRMSLACGSREEALDSELAERVTKLRHKGLTPKEIARALGLKPADVMPMIRAIGAQAPRREAPVAGCWVTEHWADKLGVAGHADWPGMSPPESESGE